MTCKLPCCRAGSLSTHIITIPSDGHRTESNEPFTWSNIVSEIRSTTLNRDADYSQAEWFLRGDSKKTTRPAHPRPVVVAPSTRKFPRFLWLPYELRLMVWRSAACPRQIEADAEHRYEKSKILLDSCKSPPWTSIPLYYVCKESRKFAIEHWGQPSEHSIPFSLDDSISIAVFNRPNSPFSARMAYMMAENCRACTEKAPRGRPSLVIVLRKTLRTRVGIVGSSYPSHIAGDALKERIRNVTIQCVTTNPVSHNPLLTPGIPPDGWCCSFWAAFRDAFPALETLRMQNMIELSRPSHHPGNTGRHEARATHLLFGLDLFGLDVIRRGDSNKKPLADSDGMEGLDKWITPFRKLKRIEVEPLMYF
ncbi:hypothetical protein OQA88_7688 [Cercophora sp. LCS_1]